jgi:predicted peptidase
MRHLPTPVLIVLLAVTALEGAEPLPLSKHTYQDTTGKILPYRLLEPLKVEEGQRYPLVIFLHGAGERGTDNEKQLVHGVPQFASETHRKSYPCYLIAPQCAADKKWVEVDWSAMTHSTPKEPSEGMRLLFELLDRFLKDHPVDAKRVYLTGLSMGGYGTWDAIARRPDFFAAAVPVCGGADEATADKVKHVPLWVFHGAKDTVVKPEHSRTMVAALEKAGMKPKYTEYPDVAHDSWNPAYKDPEMYKWLFAQRRK